MGEAAVPRLTVGGRRREDLEAELAGRLLTAPVLADPLRRRPLGREAGMAGVDEQDQAVDARVAR